MPYATDNEGTWLSIYNASQFCLNDVRHCDLVPLSVQAINCSLPWSTPQDFIQRDAGSTPISEDPNITNVQNSVVSFQAD